MKTFTNIIIITQSNQREWHKTIIDSLLNA